MNTANEIDEVRLHVLDIHHRLANVATELNLAADMWDVYTVAQRQHFVTAWNMKLTLLQKALSAPIAILKP